MNKEKLLQDYSNLCATLGQLEHQKRQIDVNAKTVIEAMDKILLELAANENSNG